MSAIDVPDPGEDLSHLENHLTRQLKRLGDLELEQLTRVCKGELGPNPSDYHAMEWCGRRVTRELLEFADGRVLVGRCIQVEKERRARMGGRPNLGQRGHNLVDYLRRKGKLAT